jgi:hypothetical protein
MISYEGVIDQGRIRIYRQKVESICYSAIITRPDIAKSASKLAEFLVNLGSLHLKAVDHCLHYLHVTKHLSIRYSASGGGELFIKTTNGNFDHFDHEKSHIFETTADASYANEVERRSAEGYTFKLFEDLID